MDLEALETQLNMKQSNEMKAWQNKLKKEFEA
jgi:hypothetical protein